MTIVYWQINWFACVGLTIVGLPEIAGLAVLPLLLRGILQSASVRALVLPSLVCGVMAELLFQYFGWTNWIVGISYWGLPPLFLLGLWLNMALAWETFLSKAPGFLIYPLFLVGTTPAYLGGASVGCIEVSSSWLSYLGIGFVYCVALSVMHLILRIREKL